MGLGATMAIDHEEEVKADEAGEHRTSSNVLDLGWRGKGERRSKIVGWANRAQEQEQEPGL